MLARLRSRRPSHATVVAYLALFVALGGTSAWATHEVINSSDVVNESLTGADIQNGTLTGADVFNNTISGADITNGSLTGADVFDNTIGGADITNGSLTGADIANESIGVSDIGSQQVGADEVINDSLLQSDIRAGAVTGDEVLDNSLNDEDIAQGTFVNFTLAFPSPIAPHDCAIQPITGVDAQGDHLLLTPNTTTGGGRIVYSATYTDAQENAWVTACNTSTSTITPGNVRFNLLVIDAQ